MLSGRGFTFFELLVVMALITVVSAIAVPVLMEGTTRNQVWTASEMIGAQIRQARLKAISRNMTFRVRFNCPAAGQLRVLRVTGDGTTDNADDRCDDTLEYDSGIYQMPGNVSYGDSPPTLTVNSRGVFTSTGSIPAVLTVSSGTSSRSMHVSGTGQIAFDE